MDLKEINWDGLDWVVLSQNGGAAVSVGRGHEPSTTVKMGKFLNSVAKC